MGLHSSPSTMVTPATAGGVPFDAAAAPAASSATAETGLAALGDAGMFPDSRAAAFFGGGGCPAAGALTGHPGGDRTDIGPPVAFTALWTAAAAALACVVPAKCTCLTPSMWFRTGLVTSKTPPPTISFWPVGTGPVWPSSSRMSHSSDDCPSSSLNGGAVGDGPLWDLSLIHI